jgi:hypothetical protein
VRLSSINPVLPTFRARRPNVKVEVDIEDRFVDIVAEGYDAGRGLSEAIERDMVQGRLTDAFRFVVVGALERHGTPEKPQEDAMREEEQRPRRDRELALLALLASVLAVAAPLVAEHLDVPWRSMVGWLRIPTATFVMVVVWAAVYYLLPNVTQTIPSILPGAVVGVLVWLAATLGFSFYVAHFGNFGVTYGALGALVVLLVWMWLSSLALMLGAEINAVIRKTRR